MRFFAIQGSHLRFQRLGGRQGSLVKCRAPAFRCGTEDAENGGQSHSRKGAYEYDGGVNWRAVIALGVGIAVALPGLVVAPLRFLYDYAWFVGFAVAGGLYLALMQRSPEPVEMPELEGQG